MFTAKEIRQKFLEYFQENGHTVVDSSSLIPRNDPSLLFANSGMVQFKQAFLGQEKYSFTRATTAQKCLRVSGKHNDLENVGRTARHHTFFEMLGNFSFGDYFKEKAITLAWDFITKELSLPIEKLYVTVYVDDDEAFNLWTTITNIDPSRILRISGKDNFWSMGDTGPCGPCSEIFVDQGEDLCCGDTCGIGKCDCDRYLEIWNLVFMQYNQNADGTRDTLPKPSIDTGMGLERIAAVCQGKRSNFDGDLFQDIIQMTAHNAGVKYSFSLPNTNDVDTALRVIADHSRSAAFLIADGIMPLNEGRGYVLRRLIRRALRFGTLIGLKEAFMYKTVDRVIQVMGDTYPELVEKQESIVRVVHEEENRFRLTLGKGLILLEEEMDRAEGNGIKIIQGDIAFRLYDTYGFPLDIIQDIVQKRQFSVDEIGYREHMEMQKTRARAAWKGSGDKDLASRFKILLDSGLVTEFCGYTHLKGESRIIVLLDAEAMPVDRLGKQEKGYVLTGMTPFYAASGGQAGDTGLMQSATATVQVIDTVKVNDLTIHDVEIQEGELLLDQEICLEVTEGVRLASARNHTCTHMLHTALREVLGEHVHQAGSLVTADRLRFDFSHYAAMTPDEIVKVENCVNEMIFAAHPVLTEEMPQDEARTKGAVALFGEKYGEMVRVVSVGYDPVSVEFCGGTHLSNTGQAGMFSIISEAGIAAGTRRIEALTGWNTVRLLHNLRHESQTLCAELKTKPGEILARIHILQKEVKQLRKDMDKANVGMGMDLMGALEDIRGIKVLAQQVPSMSVKALRDSMDDVRSKLPHGIACLATEDNGKVQLLLYVSKSLHDTYTAPVLIKEIVGVIHGSGGGRPDLAQAGGTKLDGIPDAMQMLKDFLSRA